MKVISVNSARTSWLFPLSELNPTGKSVTEVFLQLQKKYNFRKAPAHMFDIDQTSKGLVFEQGEFVNRDIVPIIVKLSIFTDGLVADCWSSTRDSEDFLKDVVTWLKLDHGLSLPSDRIAKTIYMSELIVTTEKNPESINPKMERFCQFVADKVSSVGRDNPGYTMGGLSLWVKDHNQSNPAPQYRFELKAGTPLEERRFYSAAPVTTDDHIAILNEHEKLLFV